MRLDWQLRLCAFGTRRAAAHAFPPGTARHQRAAVTPAEYARAGMAILPRRSSLEPGKVTVKGGACGTVTS